MALFEQFATAKVQGAVSDNMVYIEIVQIDHWEQ